MYTGTPTTPARELFNRYRAIFSAAGACLGRVDIVAVAAGRIIVSDRTKVIQPLEATVPMAQSREADFKRLVGEGFISSHATQDKTRERVELERDLVVQRAKLAEAQSALMKTQQTKAAYRSIVREHMQPSEGVTGCYIARDIRANLIAPEIDGKTIYYNWWPLAKDWMRKTYGATE